MNAPLSGQAAVITGAGSGIGRAVAVALAEAGARVALLGRNRDNLEGTRALLGASAGAACVAACDVTDRAQVAGAVTAALADFGAIDIAVCAAGINVAKRSLRTLDPADWDRIVATNLTGAFNVVHHVLPAMVDRGAGLIVQIASISALRPSAISGAAYSASKAAMATLGACIGREERGRNVRSTVIYAGEVRTSFLESRAGRPGGEAGRHREGILEPADVAAAVLFVAGLPPHAHVPQLVLKPTIDDFA